MKRIIFYIILLVAIIARPLFIISTHQDQFFERTYHNRYPGLKKLYYSSQYMIKKNPAIIPDETLEAFAGGIFLKGLNPILIVHDQPPLGRYLTAFSIAVFDNESTLIILWFGLSAFGLFLIARKIYKNSLYALLPVAIFINEPLMLIKLVATPLLETIQLPFIIFSIYFFMRMIEKKNFSKWMILTSLSLGTIISIKYFVLGATLLFSFFLFLLLKKRFHQLFYFILTLPLALIILAISYTRTIEESYSIVKPFSVQKYIFTYQKSKFTQIGTVWDLLLFNRWHTWWGNMSIGNDVNWIVFWPLSFILDVKLLMLGLFRKVKILDPEIVLFLWIGTYGAMLSAGAVSTRYFLPWVPFFYILAFSLVFRVKIIKRFFES